MALWEEGERQEEVDAEVSLQARPCHGSFLVSHFASSHHDVVCSALLTAIEETSCKVVSLTGSRSTQETNHGPCLAEVH